MTIYYFNDLKGQPPRLEDPFELHAHFIHQHIFSNPYPNGRSRVQHGSLHASRVCINFLLFYNLYHYFAGDRADRLDELNLKLSRIAAYLHDSGRDGDGEDLWEEHSALNCYYYMVNVLGVSPFVAGFYAEMIFNKDAETKYYQFKIRNNQIEGWVEVDIRYGPHWQIQLLHDADCLDVIRARHKYNAHHLYFYHDVVETLCERSFKIDVLAHLIAETRHLIFIHGNSFRRKDAESIRRYECAFNPYRAIVDSIDPIRFPLISLFISPRQNRHEISARLSEILDQKIDNDPVNARMMEGKVFARAIRYPLSAKMTKPKPNAVIETSSEYEIYKVMRRPRIQTRSNKPDNASKDGNQDRSVSAVGYGARIFRNLPIGFLLWDVDPTKITQISLGNLRSGRGKKKDVSSRYANVKINDEHLEMLLHYLKIGHVDKNAKETNTNEILMHIHEYQGIFIERHYSSAECHDSSIPLLQAFYLQQLYASYVPGFQRADIETKAGDVLPIYEYEIDRNQLTKIHLDKNMLIAHWKEAVEEMLDLMIILFEKDPSLREENNSWRRWDLDRLKQYIGAYPNLEYWQCSVSPDSLSTKQERREINDTVLSQINSYVEEIIRSTRDNKIILFSEIYIINVFYDLLNEQTRDEVASLIPLLNNHFLEACEQRIDIEELTKIKRMIKCFIAQRAISNEITNDLIYKLLSLVNWSDITKEYYDELTYLVHCLDVNKEETLDEIDLKVVTAITNQWRMLAEGIREIGQRDEQQYLDLMNSVFRLISLNRRLECIKSGDIYDTTMKWIKVSSPEQFQTHIRVIAALIRKGCVPQLKKMYATEEGFETGYDFFSRLSSILNTKIKDIEGRIPVQDLYFFYQEISETLDKFIPITQFTNLELNKRNILNLIRNTPQIMEIESVRILSKWYTLAPYDIDVQDAIIARLEEDIPCYDMQQKKNLRDFLQKGKHSLADSASLFLLNMSDETKERLLRLTNVEVSSRRWTDRVGAVAVDGMRKK